MPDKIILAGIAGIAALAAIGYAAAKKAGVAPGANTFNPLSDQNLAYRGATEVLRSLTGNQVDTLGTWLASSYSDSIGNTVTAPTPIVTPAEQAAASEAARMTLTRGGQSVLWSSAGGQDQSWVNF